MNDRKALVVGIDLYSDQPLRDCVNDAEEIAVMLGMQNMAFKWKSLLILTPIAEPSFQNRDLSE